MNKITAKRIRKCPKRDIATQSVYQLYYNNQLVCNSFLKLDCYKVVTDSIQDKGLDLNMFRLFKVSEIKI